MRQDFFLIPGFFGFADLGGITYFHHLDHILTRLLEPYEIEPVVHYVSTVPTGSIRVRAHLLYEEIIKKSPDPDVPIHLIGHSTGGLDARLFATPTARLLSDRELIEPVAARVQTVVTVATPHLGTPLAFFFNSILGQNLLYLLSMATIYALRFGKFPLSTLFAMVGVVAKLDDHLGWRNTILDQFYDNLFADFEGENMEAVSAFLESIRKDQALLGQLTPGGIDLLNAAAEDRATTRYGCVITQAKAPSLRRFAEIGLDPYKQTSHQVYRLLHLLTSFVPEYPEPPAHVLEKIALAYGGLPEKSASDGVVPTWSQLHGELIHATWADHLDVCGHYSDQQSTPPHVDWLCSGTGFDGARFEALWSDVVDFVASR